MDIIILLYFFGLDKFHTYGCPLKISSTKPDVMRTILFYFIFMLTSNSLSPLFIIQGFSLGFFLDSKKEFA